MTCATAMAGERPVRRVLCAEDHADARESLRGPSPSPNRSPDSASTRSFRIWAPSRWREIDRRAERAAVPTMLVHEVLQLKSRPGAATRRGSIMRAPKRQLSDVFEDFTGSIPLGRSLFRELEPHQYPRTDAGQRRHSPSASPPRMPILIPVKVSIAGRGVHAARGACTSASLICWPTRRRTTATCTGSQTSTRASTRAAMPRSSSRSASYRTCPSIPTERCCRTRASAGPPSSRRARSARACISMKARSMRCWSRAGLLNYEQSQLDRSGVRAR